MSTPPPSDETIFAAALACPPTERAALLDAACSDDPARRARMVDLLRAHEVAEHDFMRTAASAAPRVAEPVAGEKIGRYKLLQKIGEGGCGVVYMAEQEETVRRRVALKVIKLGMDTKEVIARFEAERQALALMDHPHIARVFDGGATELGRPFFVMELVRGVPITKFCDEQNLPTAKRLELFTQVCHAVQHAHQKGIIHRDIKPSNILVTLHDGVPVPKVIDFGIAKATHGRLTDNTLFTAFEQFIGTPAYMSPEQAEMSGLDIDTRTDIYSLGVLLYELLTGRPPFDPKSLVSAGLDEIRRIIREVEPPRPSTRLSTLGDLDRASVAKQRGLMPGQLSTLLRGDLDWIVMRCLEKDRMRRYETANGLALDVLRHLHHEPILARPPAASYRLRKFVRRHRVAFYASTVVALALVAGTIVSTWQASRAMRAERLATSLLGTEQKARLEAEQQRQRAEALRATSEQQADRLAHNLYASRIKAGFDAWQRGDLTGAQVALDHYLPKPNQADLRGFEWHLLWRFCHSEQAALPSQGVRSWALAWSPDGRLLATADEDSAVRLWDAAAARERAVLKAHSKRTTAVAFSPDGSLLASGDEQGVVKLWDTSGLVEIATLGTLPSAIGSLTFSRDGRQLAAANTRVPAESGTPWTRIVTSGSQAARVAVWDVARRTESVRFSTASRGVQAMVFAADGQSVLTAGIEGAISQWSLPNGTAQRTFSTTTKAPSATLFALALSPDGTKLAAGGGDPYAREPFLQIWNVTTGAEEGTYRHHRGPVLALAFVGQGRQLASAGVDQILRIVDLASGNEVRSFRGHAGAIWNIAATPDGSRVATTSWDRTVKIWAVAQPQVDVIAGSNNHYSAAFSPDSRWLATGGERVLITDAKTGRLERTLPDYRAGDLICRFSPDGALLATAGTDRVITLWDTRTWQRVASLKGHTDKIRCLAFSRDGRTLASGGFMKDRTIRLWDVAQQRERQVITDATSSVESLAFTASGATLIASSFAEVMFFDLPAGKLQDRWIEKDAMIALSSDDRWLAVSRPGGIHLLDASTRQLQWATVAHHDWVWAVAFSPDNRTLATTSWDGTAKLWNVATGQELFRHEANGVCWGTAFSPDNRQWVVGSGSARAGYCVAFRTETAP